MKAVSGSWHKKWPKAIRPRVSSKAGWSGLKLLLIALASANLRDRSLRHSASAIPKTRLCSLGPDGLHSSIKAACNASNSRGSSPGRMRGSAKTPCFCAFEHLRLRRGATELFGRPLCLNTGGIEWFCLRMAAPSSNGVESMPGGGSAPVRSHGGSYWSRDWTIDHLALDGAYGRGPTDGLS